MLCYVGQRLPRLGKAEMAHNLAPERRQMRIAAMTWVRTPVHDLRHDPCGTLAQHDDPTGKKDGFFHVVGDQKRGEARALP